MENTDSFIDELIEEPNWWRTGRFLGAPTKLLEVIDIDHGSKGVRKCLREVFVFLETVEKIVLWKDVYEAQIEMGNIKSALRIEKEYMTISADTTSLSLDNPLELQHLFSDPATNDEYMQLANLLFDKIIKLQDDSNIIEDVKKLVCDFVPIHSNQAVNMHTLKLIIHQNYCFINCTFICHLSNLFPNEINEDWIEKIGELKDMITLESAAFLTTVQFTREPNPLQLVVVRLNIFWKEVTFKKFERLEEMIFETSPCINSIVYEFTNKAIKITWTLLQQDLITRVRAKIEREISFIKALGIMSFEARKDKVFNAITPLTNKQCTFSTSIEEAVTNSNLQAAELLLAVCSFPRKYINKKLLSITDSEGKNILHIACSKGHHDVVELLIDCGANPDSVTNNGRTPLIFACYFGHQSIVNVLLSECKVNANQTDDSGKSPLFHASSRGYKQIAATLISYRADPLLTTKHEKATSLMVSSQHGHVNIVKLLLDEFSDLDVDAINCNNATALMYACERGHTEVVKLLLQYKSNPNIKRKHTKFQTPLIIASKKGFVEIAKLLIQAKADVNLVQEENGGTALYVAAEEGRLSVVSVLCEAGADTTILRDNRLSPLLAANYYNREDCVMLLSNSNPQDILPHAVTSDHS